MKMQFDWRELFTDPYMQFVWGMVVVLSTLTVLACKFVPDPVDPTRAHGVRQLVFEATGIRPPASRRVVWQILVWILSLSCFSGGLLINIDRLKQGLGQSIAGWLLIATFLLIAVAMANVRPRACFWIYQKLLLADYSGALARTDLLVRWFPETPIFHFVRGTVLYYAGRLAESEQAFRTSIEKGQIRAGAILPVALTSLGEVLLHLGRLREATIALETSIKIHTRYAGAHNALAEILLRRGREPQRALLLVDNALQLRKSQVRTRNIDRHNLANMYANRARALALLGQMDEAVSAIATAESAGDSAFIPGLAGTCWRCGVAFCLMNQENAAIEQFRKATEIDPHGLYGKLSASAMHEPLPSLIESQG
jgi:tetratricopeptide (TPR) repeat protein